MPRQPIQVGQWGEIRTYQSGDSWRAMTRFGDADGKIRQIERSGPSPTKARRRLKDACQERARRGTTRKSEGMRFRDLVEPWLKNIASECPETTVNTYRGTLDNMVLDRIGDLRLIDITTGRLEDLFVDFRVEGYSAAYRRQARTVIRGPLALAAQYEWIKHDPIANVSRIKGKAKRKVRSLTPQERVGLLHGIDTLAESDPYFKRSMLPALVRFMLGTGVRIGEALAVRWCDLNLSDAPVMVDGEQRPPHSVHINGNVVFVTGKGCVRNEGKTENANRMLVLPEFLVTMLMVRRDPEAEDMEPVFPSERLGWRYPNNVRRSLRGATKKILEATGEDYTWITSHVFRKTAATILDDEALSPRQVADQLGHSKPSMTQDVYMGRGTANPAAAAALHAAYTKD